MRAPLSALAEPVPLIAMERLLESSSSSSCRRDRLERAVDVPVGGGDLRIMVVERERR